ncbi:hypothetical protein [Nocardia asteroides]|uniref:hypothetical protein n=1 Tax=Nocardia asteroides TaxID=1824 RepID=UPI001E44CFD0|nr:hypothetical protein [Nocardia asteroides]UGT53432.1 hypothetical protein LTT85_22450 [Nocardia asteroides]
MDYWTGIVQRIFYRIQFERELRPELAAQIANALLVEPIEYLTAADEYRSLADGLQRHAPLPTLVRMRQSEHDLRQFLTQVVENMDAMRPWPKPPYVPLPADDLGKFENARPIARIALTVEEIEGRLARSFNHDSEDGPFLLLRLRSGTIIGFFSPYWHGSHDSIIYVADPDVNPDDVIRELIDTGRVEPGQIFQVDTLGMQPNATRFETTPLEPAFHGEHLPGNSVWAGKTVQYLDERARQDFRLHSHDGLLHDHTGKLFDTAAAHTLWTPSGGRAIFVMDHDGYLYSAPFHILGEFHHSSLLAGAPVAGAGEIQASAGRVLLVSDQSTHYKPARRFTHQVVDSLRRQGISIGDNQVEYHSTR